MQGFVVPNCIVSEVSNMRMPSFLAHNSPFRDCLGGFWSYSNRDARNLYRLEVVHDRIFMTRGLRAACTSFHTRATQPYKETL